jgi:hypothetical protein
VHYSTGTFSYAVILVYFRVYSIGNVSYVLFYSDTDTFDTSFVHKSVIYSTMFLMINDTPGMFYYGRTGINFRTVVPVRFCAL